MKKYFLFGMIATLLGVNINCLADDAASAPAPTDPTAATAATPFTPSDFQKNAGSIKNLESDVQSYLTDREKEDLDFGLHLVNFSGSVIQTSAEQQFINDFSRISCNKQYESNLPECANSLQELSPYAHLRPSNIFDILKYNDQQLNIAKTVVRTIIDPFPDDQLNTILSDPQQAKDSDKQKTMATLIASKAGLTLAQNSLNEIMAKRYSSDQKNSVMQMIYDESFRRLIDPKWITDATKLSTNGLLLELLQVEAFKLWVDYYRFTQNERIEALLATLVSTQINSSNKINNQLNKGAEQGKKATQDTSDIINKSGIPGVSGGSPTPSQ